MFRSCAVLQRPSQNVLMYLDRATRARNLAQHAATKADREFYERMEASWMNLAASTAFVERVDLFIHTMESAALPYSGCQACRGLMRIATIESIESGDIYTFKCRRCGSEEQRTLPKKSAVPPEQRQVARAQDEA